MREVVGTCSPNNLITRMNFEPSWRFYIVFFPKVVVRLIGKFKPDYPNLSDILINIIVLRRSFFPDRLHKSFWVYREISAK